MTSVSAVFCREETKRESGDAARQHDGGEGSRGGGVGELTSCSDMPSMISETSCSLRAADEARLLRCPTRLQAGGTHETRRVQVNIQLCVKLA